MVRLELVVRPTVSNPDSSQEKKSDRIACSSKSKHIFVFPLHRYILMMKIINSL